MICTKSVVREQSYSLNKHTQKFNDNDSSDDNNNDNVMLKKNEIILIKSCGNSKTKIFYVMRGLMIDAKF